MSAWRVGLLLAALLPWAARAAPAPGSAVALRCLGAHTMQPLVADWARQFAARYPLLRVAVPDVTRYSAAGFDALLAGRVDCVTFAREPFPAETAAYRARFGGKLLIVPVAGGSFDTPHGTFALAVYVHAGNPLPGLTLAQLAAILGGRGPDGMALTRWGQLGLRGRWMQRPLHVYGMTPIRASGNPPGIVNFLDDRVLRGRPWRADLRIESDRAGMSALQAIVAAVAADPAGLGISGFGDARPGARALPLTAASGQPLVAGTPASVAAARYPLARRIYLGFRVPSAGPLPPALCAWLDFVLGPRAQARIGTHAMHFLPLTASALAQARRRVRDAGCAASPPPRYLAADGALRVVGYNDMRWLLEAIDRRYARAHPGTRFDLVLHGTRSAPPALIAGTSVFAPMGADFSDADLAAYRRAVGTDPLRFRVAHDALDPRARSAPLGVFVNARNPLTAIPVAALAHVFASASSHGVPVTRWGQLGLTGAWAGRAIHPCGLTPPTALGTLLRRRLFPHRSYAAGYAGYAESAAVIRRVAEDPDALCFADLNMSRAGVRALGLIDASGRLSRGTRAGIIAGRYPLDRHLLIDARQVPGHALDPRVCSYLRLVLSRAGQALIAAAPPHYLPLNAGERRVGQAQLARACRPVALSD